MPTRFGDCSKCGQFITIYYWPQFKDWKEAYQAGECYFETPNCCGIQYIIERGKRVRTISLKRYL